LRNGQDLTPEKTLKEELCGIDEQSLIVEEGKHRIQEWLNQAGAVYNPAITTIGNPLDGISNYLRNRTTSGATVGINNHIKLIKRQAHSFVNFNNFRERLLVCFSKLVIVITILTGELFS